MPDLAMCKNFECARRSGCYRYMAIPKPSHQEWHNIELGDGDSCESFLQLQRADRVQRLEDADAASKDRVVVRP